MSEERRRYMVPGYMWAYMQRRRYYVAVMAFLAAVVAILLEISSSLTDYGMNLSLNLAADLIGTIVVLSSSPRSSSEPNFIVTPCSIAVRMLLLDPDARAAEQRADDLLRRTNVVDNIMDNLLVLNNFRTNLPEQLQRNIEIRVYSALPPVQMYRVDDRIVVSFYPVNITSWNAAQYQTSPRAQLGTFVGNKV